MAAGSLIALAAQSWNAPDLVRIFQLWAGTLLWALGCGGWLTLREDPVLRGQAKAAFSDFVALMRGNMPVATILLCVLAIFCLAWLAEQRIGNREVLGWTGICVFILCAAFTIRLFWTHKQMSALIRRWKSLKLIAPLLSFVIFVHAKSMADGEIQYWVGISPEEFSTASHAIAGLYTIASVMVLSAAAFVLAALYLSLELLLDTFREIAGPSHGAGVTLPKKNAEVSSVLILGLLFSALGLMLVPSSHWGARGLQRLTKSLLVTTAFFEPPQGLRRCIEEMQKISLPTMQIRLIADGKVAIFTDGSTFMRVESNSAFQNCPQP